MEQLMNTINGTYERAVKEGLGVSKNLLRSLVKSNTIPYVQVGNSQVLINFEILKNFLFTGSVQAPTSGSAGGIHPISERLTAAR